MSEHIIIAGIAAEDQAILRKCLDKHGGVRNGNNISFLEVKKKNPIYKEDVIKARIDSLANTVSKKKPAIIRVIYVPYQNSHILKKLFFPFADAQSLDDANEYCQYVLKYFRNIDELSQQLLKVIRIGLKIKKHPSKRDYVMLPNKNFIIEHKKFSELLYEFYFGCLDQNIFKCIKMNNKFRGYEDSRNLVFPVSKMAEALLRFEPSKMSSKYFLTGIFRLGRAWNPGFHFDVRHNSKSTLNGYQFQCSIKDEVEANGVTHVNIYLNDFIRLPKTKK